MRNAVRAASVFALSIAASCGGPTEPQWDDPGGTAVAWFNGLDATVDLYFPGADYLVRQAFVAGEAPNDIIPLGSGRFAVVNSTSSNVSFFDLSDQTPEGEVQLPTGSNPYAACLAGDALFVALLLADSVAMIDTQSMQVSGYIPVGGNPDAVAAAGGLIFVGHGNYPDDQFPSGITVLDPVSGLLLDTIPAPENVTGMRYFQSTNRIHAVSTTYMDDGAITIVDPDARQVTGTIATGGAPGLPSEAQGAFVAGDWGSAGVYIYSETALDSIWATGGMIVGIAARGDTLYMTDFGGNRILVGLLSEEMLIDTLEAGAGPQGVAIIPR